MDALERIAQLSPAKLALLEQRLQKNQPGPVSRPAAAERRQYAPLSFSQERLWFLDQLEPDSGLYNLPALLPLSGPVDPGLVEEAIRQVVSRHGALRTRFVVRDERPCQVVGDDARAALDFSTIDLRGAGLASDGPQLSRALNDQIWAPFDLAEGPLLRARLILRRGEENLLLVVMHHIVSDGWSINLFTRELRELYEAARSGRPADLPAPLQYVDHAIHQRQTLEGERLQSLLAYWRDQLDGAPSRIALPLDHPRPARQSFQGALHPFTVPRPALQKLGQLCREQGVVPFMVLLSAFKVLLFRYTDQSKIVVGTPIANRGRSELESVIGFFTNTLVLCSGLSSGMTFRGLLAQVRRTTLGAYEHQELPFEKLVSELQPERSLSHNPLFQVMFTFQNLPGGRAAPRDEVRGPERPAEALSLDFRSSKFDLTLAMTETDGGLSAVFEYATDLFESATIERMAGHLVTVLQHVLEHPDEPIGGFDFLSESERQLVVELWNDTGREWPEVLPLHARFERQARRTPDAAAVVFQGSELTYRELDRRANRVARLLRSDGVGRGAIVGICLPRSLEMLVGLYGILKAGAAYLPIEPDFPEDRVAYMLSDAKVGHVLTTSACLPALSPHAVKAVALDRLEPGPDGEDDVAVPVEPGPEDLAYVLFTSGSTGQPKGVMISHAAIDNRLQWMQAEYGLEASDRVMQKTPFTFDVSVWELFWPLAVGACLVVAEPERHKESVYLVDLIRKERITCLHFVPSMLQLFLHEDLSGCGSLTRIFCSGEALAVEHVRRLQALPGVKAYNLYGPTEAAVDVTHWDCADWRDQYLSVPIGRPISNTRIYILNDRLQPAPIGVPGELYIGGRNLARGYLNKPELTASRFILSPFSKEPGARLYRTGDLARLRSDGNIEYIGRLDSQVKLRGLRIELGEIETVLGQCPGVAEAAVIVHRFGAMDERLAAYVVAAPGAAFDAGAARAFLGKKLPSYMVPATLTVLPELPLTPNGKLDRKRLPQPAAAPRASEPVASASDLERELLAIWRKVLKTDAVGTTDDFFALGGHSLLVTQAINAINRQYHLEVPVRLLFENPTVKALARALSELEDQTWLDETQAASTMLTRSDLRLLQTLDERSEQELDDLLKRLLEGPAAQRFDDARSLLAWARSDRPAQAPAPGPDGDERSPGQAYLECWLGLSQIAASVLPREHARAIFERYARWSRQRFLGGGGAMTPAELSDHCVQLMAMASLAATLGPNPDREATVLSRNELSSLGLAEKREIARALLRSAFDAPRSFPLSYAQEQLWFMDKLQPGSPLYNIPLYVPFQGAFDEASLRRALEALAARHDMLRVHFDTVDDQPVQIVEPRAEVDLRVEDLSGLAAGERDAALGRFLNEEVQRPFDLSGACIRYTLYRLDPLNHLLSATMHHIVADAWSLGVFVSELNALYRGSSLPPLQVEYSDYARWQRATLRGLRMTKLVSYWTQQLAGAPQVLRLPVDRPRSKDQTFNGTVAGFVLDDALSESLLSLARRQKVTTFMLLLACYDALLYRYTGQEDILVGAPVANRGHPELEPIVGIFVNTLILRARLREAQTFAELLRDVQATALAAFEHQALPFPKLVDQLNVERVAGYPPLYQVVFNFQNAALIESANPGAEGEVMHRGGFPFVHSNTTKVDLNLTVTQNGSRISGGIEYNTDLFDRASIDDMIGCFKAIAERIARDPSVPLMDIPLGNAAAPARPLDLDEFDFGALP